MGSVENVFPENWPQLYLHSGIVTTKMVSSAGVEALTSLEIMGFIPSLLDIKNTENVVGLLTLSFALCVHPCMLPLMLSCGVPRGLRCFSGGGVPARDRGVANGSYHLHP